MKCKISNITLTPIRSPHLIRNASGFTLLELLIVVSLLAVVATTVVVAYQNVDDDAGLNVARHEILQIKDALLNFRRDTGFFPKQGPFNILGEGTGRVLVGDSGGPSHLPSDVPPAQSTDWFNSPANFWQLYGRDEPCPNLLLPSSNPRSPICGMELNFTSGNLHPLESFNPDTRRGWNGPYLKRFGEGMVEISDGLKGDGSGSPIDDNNATRLQQVRGVADPFQAPPVSTGIGNLLLWRFTATAGGPNDNPQDRWGRPFLAFDLDNDNARVVSMGPNRQYETCDLDDDGDCDSTDMPDLCVPPPDSDDLVACLLR